jgi:putative cardiolipin synthase
VVRDDPAKTLDPTPERGMLALAQVFDATGPPARSFDLISPYFVPGEKGTAAIASVARRGVRVRVLTNSLAGTDVAVVHSGYAKRRCELARAGVQLYELKPTIATASLKGAHVAGSPAGSSRASLHAKTFALDEDRIFVGSFNFDPRSALLNTEMGLVIHSPTLARRLAATFDGAIVQNAYAVRARGDGECIEWVETTAGGEKVLETEPDTSALRRFWLALLMALPIDWLL